MFNRVWLVVLLLCVSVGVVAQERVEVYESVRSCSTFEDGVFTPCEFVRVTKTIITEKEKTYGEPIYAKGAEERLLKMGGRKLTEAMILYIESSGKAYFVKTEKSLSNLFFEEVASSFLVYEDGVISVRTDREVVFVWANVFLVGILLLISLFFGLVYRRAPYYKLPALFIILASAIAGFVGGPWLGGLVGFLSIFLVAFLLGEVLSKAKNGESIILLGMFLGLSIGVGIGIEANLIARKIGSGMVLYQLVEFCVMGILLEQLFARLRARYESAKFVAVQ